ncbi:MAG: phosphatase PAP2 family protein [Actinobacteria bacterium]|nr:phosphatase PAP2 family protein [Actinomycetota bacterium]
MPWLDRWGFPVAIGAAVLFGALAVMAAFFEPVLLRADRPAQLAVIDLRGGWVDEAMAFLSLLGTRYVIGALLVALGAVVLLTGRCRFTLMVLVAAFLLNPVAEFILKEGLIARTRPDVLQLVPGRGASFPSGHVLASVGFFGMLPVLAWEATGRTWVRAAAVVLGIGVVLGVAFSRMYLGVHWLTDVVGGLLLGTAIVVGTHRALRGHHLHRSRRCCPQGDRPAWTGRQGPRLPSSLLR